MIRTIARHIIPAMLAVITILAGVPFVESVMRLRDQSIPAIEWHDARVVTPIVKAGGVLEVVYTATINKQCPSDLIGFLVAADGSVPVRLPVVTGGYRKPSEGPVEISVKVMIPAKSDSGLAPLVSGRYSYRTLATRYCGDGTQEDASVPDAEFYLEVP